MSVGVRDSLEQDQIRTVIPTMAEVRKIYGPARTLGAPQDAVIAMDSSLEISGAYTLLQHSFEEGQGYALGPQFMGYAALSGLTQNGLVRACIETVADDMTREWIEIDSTDSDENEDEAEKKKVIEEALIEYKVKETFHKAAELTGYFGGCLIFIDTGAKGDQLLTPLDISDKSAEIKRFKKFLIIEPINIFPGNYNSTDPLSDTYFNPEWWWVLGTRVHATRLIRIVANEVPVLLKPSYNFLGVPQAQIIWDYVLHFQDCRGYVGRLLEKFSLTALATDMQDILTNPNSTKSLDQRLAYMARVRNNDGMLAYDKEMEEIVQINTPLSGATDITRQALEFLACLNRTPAVKLLGISPSGFNATGDSDLTNYNDHVLSQDEKITRPGVQKCLDVIQIVKFGKADKSITFKYRPLNKEDEAKTAATQKSKADTDAVYLDRAVVSQEEVRKKLASDKQSGYSDITPEDVPEMPNENETNNPDSSEANSGEVNERESGDRAGVSKEAA